jgi:rubrerythrin
MSGEFTAAEIAELGIQIEKNGFEFYSKLAERATHESVKEVFSYLAGEEKSHIAAFQKIHDSSQAYDSVDQYPDDYFAYMKDLASEHVFAQAGAGLVSADKVGSEIEGIDIALKFEKESIKFFEAMKKIVKDSDSTVVDKLIEEEKRHIEKLNLLKSTYL